MSKLPLEDVHRALTGATEVMLSHREDNTEKFVRDWDWLNDVAATPEIIASMAHEILNHRALAEAEHRARVMARRPENIPALGSFVNLDWTELEGWRTEPKEGDQ